jgi:acyl-CoA oxidase
MIDTTSIPDSPGLLTLLPLFYIGWSDSVLSPSEMELIHERVKAADWLTAAEKDYLISYTDPKHPPSAETFKAWVEILQKHSDSLTEDDKASLSKIGLQLATSATGTATNGRWNDDKTITALQSIESAMGLDNQESVELLRGRLDEGYVRQMAVDSKVDDTLIKAWLDGDTVETKDRMRKLLRDPFFAHQHIPDKDRYREVILDQVKALAAQGLGGYAFPSEFGGGGELGKHITVFEMLAYGDLSRLIKFGVQFGLFGGAVYGLGTEKHHRKYIAPLTKADLLGCFAMTETGHGSNVRGLKTTATYDASSDTITIHSPDYQAGKEYIGNAMHSSMAAVFADLIVDGTSHGVHCVLVPIRDADHQLLPGVKVVDCGYKMGLNGVDNGRIWFDNVVVPRDNLLDKYGAITDDGTYTSPIKNPSKRFFTMLGALVVGRICVGMAGNNATKTALTIAIKHAFKRRQFSAKEGQEELQIIEYPTHQRRLLPRLARTYAYHCALEDLAHQYTQADVDHRKIETQAAGLKAMASWHATDTIQECREALGGKGYLTENRIADLKADTDIFTTFEGDNTVLLQLVAKGLLTEYKQSFHDEGFMAVVRYLNMRVANTAAEYNPIYRRQTSTDHLLDPDFHNHAFRYHEKKLLLTLAERMQSYLKKRINPHDAFLKCQTHMVALAKAHTDRLALKAFTKRLAKMKAGIEKAALQKTCALYALATIENNKGFYLEADYMDGSKTKAIRRQVSKLCAELKEVAVPLVDGFAIPSELIDADVLKPDVKLS